MATPLDFHASHPAPSHVVRAEPPPLAPRNFSQHRSAFGGERPALSKLDAVQVTVSWGSTILCVRQLARGRNFEIGEGSREAPVDFEVSADQLGASRVRLVEAKEGLFHLAVPEAGRAFVGGPSNPALLPCEARSLRLDAGAVVEICVARLVFRIAVTKHAERAPRAGLMSVDRAIVAAYALSFGAAAALLTSFALWMPNLGMSDSDDTDSERLYVMRQYLNAEAERNREQEEKTDAAAPPGEPGAAAPAARGPEGKLGKASAPVKNLRAAVRGEALATQLSRAEVVAEAKAFGMIALLGTESSAPSAAWIASGAAGHDALDADGNLWGDAIGESFGNGLRLAGPANGGGGHGTGVTFDGKLGTCAAGDCGQTGVGRDFGRLGLGHHTRAPKIRPNGTATVSGRLPPEVVQRIVRQNFGRFRMCYETGLRKNPNLGGRVNARFVISREGSVSNVQNAGSDLPDAGVVSCVVQAFYGLSFPTPENGIVSVSYPILFAPE